MPGKNAVVSPITNLRQGALDLAQFLIALQKVDTTDAPFSYRGQHLAVQDAEVRVAIDALDGIIEAKAVTMIWEECLKAPAWNKPPVWCHGDLLPANILTQEGNLSAVIDFGSFGIGDPACDLIAAWSIFSSDTRNVFRETLQVDYATWMRGKGWALSIGLIILPYYQNTNPGLVAIGNRLINEVMQDL